MNLDNISNWIIFDISLMYIAMYVATNNREKICANGNKYFESLKAIYLVVFVLAHFVCTGWLAYVLCS